MKPFLIIALLAIIGSVKSMQVSTIDACHTAYDIKLDSMESRFCEDYISVEKFKNLGKPYYSYDHCEKMFGDRKDCKSFRLIVDYKSSPARIISCPNATIPQEHIHNIDSLKSGDRLILEQIEYEEDGVTLQLRPVVFKIQ